MAVMMLAVAIVTGFQNEIRSKVIGFGSHIQITNLDLSGSPNAKPVSTKQPFYPHLDTVAGIRHIQVFASKAGIIKTKDEVHGVILKGIGADYDWSFFEKTIKEGAPFHVLDSFTSNNVLVSKQIASKLKLKIDDHFRMYFVQNPIRQRKFTIVGIYETGLEQLDDVMILGDIKHIQKLNRWDATQVSGFDVMLEDYKDLERLDEFIYKYIGFDLNSVKITERHPEIFGWLELLDYNVIVILLFAVLVAAINMISALLILILEKTSMIGILKALGANNWSVRKIFLYKAGYLIGKGLLWGNIIGLGLCFIQMKFGIITLPQETYYLSEVPINLDPMHLILLNFGTFIICLLMLLLPSYVIARITPVKAIRFN